MKMSFSLSQRERVAAKQTGEGLIVRRLRINA